MYSFFYHLGSGTFNYFTLRNPLSVNIFYSMNNAITRKTCKNVRWSRTSVNCCSDQKIICKYSLDGNVTSFLILKWSRIKLLFELIISRHFSLKPCTSLQLFVPWSSQHTWWVMEFLEFLELFFLWNYLF